MSHPYQQSKCSAIFYRWSESSPSPSIISSMQAKDKPGKGRERIAQSELDAASCLILQCSLAPVAQSARGANEESVRLGKRVSRSKCHVQSG